MTVSLTLDGERLLGKEIRMQVTYSIATEDLSGQSSITTDAEKGHKAQVVRARMLVPHTDREVLKTIRRLAGKLAEDGSRHIYTIVNETTEAMDIRQVRFYGDMAVREDRRLKAWLVTFLLKEHRSVAEKQEEQRDQSQLAQVEQNATPEQAQEVDIADIEQQAET